MFLADAVIIYYYYYVAYFLAKLLHNSKGAYALSRVNVAYTPRHTEIALGGGGGSLADCSRVPVLAFELCIVLLISQCRRGVLLAVNLFVEGTQYGQL